MRKHIYTGVMGSIYFNFITGVFFVYYATRIGMTKVQMGLMGGIASFTLATQLLSGVLTQRSGRRKLLWFTFALANRIVRISGILLSLWLWHIGSPYAVIVLIGAICLANFLAAQGMPPWMSWLADIIPERHHGHFLGRRQVWIALFGILVFVPAGLLVDHVPEDRKLTVVVSLLVMAALIGILDILIHGTIPEPRVGLPKRRHFLHEIMEPLRDRGFRPWLIFNACWTFSITLGGAVVMFYIVKDLRIEHNMAGGVVVLTGLVLLGTMIAGRPSGTLVDRLGPKRVLFWGHLGWATLPLFWIFATPKTALFVIGASSLFAGAACIAALTAANKLITRFPTPEHRAMYVGVSSSLGCLAGGFGALTASGLLWGFGDWQTSLAGWTVTGFHVVFLASFALRLLSVTVILRPVRDPQPEATPTP